MIGSRAADQNLPNVARTFVSNDFKVELWTINNTWSKLVGFNQLPAGYPASLNDSIEALIVNGSNYDLLLYDATSDDYKLFKGTAGSWTNITPPYVSPNTKWLAAYWRPASNAFRFILNTKNFPKFPRILFY